VQDIFEDPSNLVYRTANKAKIQTKQEVLRRELLFREGEEFDDFLVFESERRLRDLKYLRRIQITPTADGDFVDLHVRAQDVWTFIPQFNYSASAGKKNVSAVLIETDFLGLGKRVELGYEQDESREVVQGVYDDNRIFGTENRFLGALFQRSDGHEGVMYLGRPFRSLVDRSSWFVSARVADTIGRLFQDGTENYIFRQKNDELLTRYTWSFGDPEDTLDRFSLGYSYINDEFSVATLNDYNDLDLDPLEVSNDPGRLPVNRLYSGPHIAYQRLEPRFIPMNYIDRFDRVEDYNLGNQYDFNGTYASELLGSDRDAVLLSFNRSKGYQFNHGSFIRGEVGVASRLESREFVNSLARFEIKYYDVLGNLEIGDTLLGKHTLAASYFLDFGAQLDGDRQFTVGGDNALRGYKARAFTGDRRMVLNVEDRVHIADDVFQLMSVGAAAFIDAGGATNGGLDDLLTNQLYGDAGVGLRLGFPRSTGGGVVRLDVAVPFRDGPDGTRGLEVRLVVGGGQLFSSQLRSESLGPERANVAVGFDR